MKKITVLFLLITCSVANATEFSALVSLETLECARHFEFRELKLFPPIYIVGGNNEEIDILKNLEFKTNRTCVEFDATKLQEEAGKHFGFLPAQVKVEHSLISEGHERIDASITFHKGSESEVVLKTVEYL